MDNRDDMELAPDGSTRIQRAQAILSDYRADSSPEKAKSAYIGSLKIDRIEERLGGIEQVLESLAAKLGSLSLSRVSTEPSSQSQSSKVARSPIPTSELDPGTPAPFEGETTLNRQSEFARNLLERAVGNVPSVEQNAEVKSALISLQEMVSRKGQYITAAQAESLPLFNKSLSEIDASKLERPPWHIVEDVLEKGTTYPAMCFAVVFPFLKMNKIRMMFKEGYNSSEYVPAGRRILIFGVLQSLFIEFGSFPMLGNENYRQYSNACRTQMELAMSQLDLCMPASYENALALLLSTSHAIEACKPSLGWTMVSAAVGMCQTLGYHRIQTMKDDTEEDRSAKLHAFWFIYMQDKTLSLRLGRASSMPDWDISLPFLNPLQNSFMRPGPSSTTPKGTEMLIYWLKLAQIQGKIYETLYSPAAYLVSEEQRAQRAVELVNALNQAWSERGDASVLDFAFKRPGRKDTSIPDKLVPQPNEGSVPSERLPGLIPGAMGYLDSMYHDFSDIFYHSDAVMHYSTVTLTQRACSSNVDFDQACLKSARSALLAHQRCSEQFNITGNEEIWSGYVHWALLQSPFTPFIVIFCNAITQNDHSDLAILSDFVSSLESVLTLSEGAGKLYKMCNLFLQVAKLYIEARNKEGSHQPQTQPQSQPTIEHNGIYVPANGDHVVDFNAVTQFDPYLSALGLVPNAAWPMAQYTSPPAGMYDFKQGQPPDSDSATSGMQQNQNTLQDWFSGSRYLMTFMENDDTQMPDLNL
ncbi:fungal-specific transcription factor domain-containing protein [Massariosphaeria phaeospora]|uniref:Fungal-specific transcription factor domain-containing protein n=1 Tax=Massariosphaeria phaeospora TaxID=100035 RepID=A0A7C8M6W8_9PLEO|nr:fungal-specific transcription factor domain-containing protein [Massariosphaeria phaeospora]